MKTTYADIEHWTTVTLMENYDPPAWIVTGVQVQERWRGMGYASALFDVMLADADREGVTLLLDIRPDGTGLNEEALDRFYASRGFVPWMGEEGDVDMDNARIRTPRGEPPWTVPTGT